MRSLRSRDGLTAVARADPQPQGKKKGEGAGGRGKRSAAARGAEGGGARSRRRGRGFREHRTSGNPRAARWWRPWRPAELWLGSAECAEHVPLSAGCRLRAVWGEDRSGGADVGDVAWRSPSCHVSGGGREERQGWERKEEMLGCPGREEMEGVREPGPERTSAQEWESCGWGWRKGTDERP